MSWSTCFTRRCGTSTSSSACGATPRPCPCTRFRTRPPGRSEVEVKSAVRLTARCLTLLGAVVPALMPARAAAQLYFGQNLVQYDRLEWRVIETEHFLVHYYPVERTAARDAARLAERSYARLSRLMQHQFREKKPIIVFQSRGDFAQSNVFGD